MKSVILIACLIASAACAPQKSAGLEREEKKMAKLQFGPSDAQVYSSAIVPEIVSASREIVIDQVVPSNYGSGYVSGVNSYVPGVVGPYSSIVGQKTLTQAGQPAEIVYEHVGQSHVGHLATAVHRRRPGHLLAGQYVPGSVATLPTSSSWNSAAGYVNGQVQYINGQPAQYVNGQWYYVDAAQIPAIVDQGVYANPLNRPSVLSVSGVKRYNQVGQSGILGVRPGHQYQDNRWYTKTNTQQPIVSPFYRQPQYSPYSPAATHHTKSRHVPRPEVQSEGERDW